MSPSERAIAAEHAESAKLQKLANAPQPACPFLERMRPGALCTKVGGICSLRQYETREGQVIPSKSQPTTTCPNRFLEDRGERSVFSYIARELFNVDSGAKVIKEIPFLEKETLDGTGRGAKAGRIDWIVVPNPSSVDEGENLKWLAVETQAVYFSGDEIWLDIKAFRDDPSKVHMPRGRRRPDYRSSGAKRLAPQLAAKSPVITRWGRKMAVVVDTAFFNEMGALAASSDFENSEVVWFIMQYSASMELEVGKVILTELSPSIAALQAAKPVNRSTFEQMLKVEISTASSKVFDA